MLNILSYYSTRWDYTALIYNGFGDTAVFTDIDILQNDGVIDF